MRAEAETIDDPTVRRQSLEDVDRRMAGVEAAFARNELDYGRKLYLIENCLYGVDIQPIAVQIAKLRVFISLVVDQRIADADANRGVLPLPNLETKFAAANTLLGIERGKNEFSAVQEGLMAGEVDRMRAELKDVRHRYFTARTPETKRKYRARDAELRKAIAAELGRTTLGDEAVGRMAAWDPYDQNAHAEFFDPEWMFGVRGGFDVVIGNPPYMRVQGLQQTQAEYMARYRQSFQSAKGSFDLYALFIERGYQLLNEHGHFAYIVPHKFFQANFGEALRRLLTRNQALRQIVRFGSEQVFDAATTYTCLLFLSKQPNKQFELIEVKRLNSEGVLGAAHMRTEHPDYDIGVLPAPVLPKEKKPLLWDFSLGEKDSLLVRLRRQPRTLGDITRKIFVGLQTSADKIYVLKVRDERKDSLLCFSKHLDEVVEIERGLVKPFLMGKDVHRYEPPAARNVVIFPYTIRNGNATLMSQETIKREFPMGWNYLERNQVDLGGREHGRMQGDKFYAYIYPKNLTEFAAVKVMTPEIALGCQMTLDNSGSLYHTTKVYSFAFKDPHANINYLLGLLNSKVLWYFLSNTGYVLRGGYYTFKTDYLKPFPIPESTPEQEKAIEQFVVRILAAKKRDPKTDTTEMEQAIDQLVYALYNLTDAEIALIEGQASDE